MWKTQMLILTIYILRGWKQQGTKNKIPHKKFWSTPVNEDRKICSYSAMIKVLYI